MVRYGDSLGTLDEAARCVRLGADASRRITNTKSVDMPYVFGWKPITIHTQNKAKIGSTVMSPRGALLRLHFYSDMLESYEVRGLRLSSNAFRASGYFSPLSVANDANQTNGQPTWTSDEAVSSMPIDKDFDLSRTSLVLTAGGKHIPERTLFLWVMPSAVEAAQSSTEIDLLLRPEGSGQEAKPVRTYSRKGHRVLAEGMSYRMSNVLTSPLMISEVYYQYASSTEQVYSIAEVYNPTASEVDLSEYALVRIGSRNNVYGYTTAGNHYPDAPASQVLTNAAFLPLGSVVGSTENNFKFPHTRGLNYTEPWYKTIYGEPSLRIKPGKTILIGGGGYVATDNKPSYNIDRFNASGYTGGSTQSLEQPDMPRAGMQPDSAVRAGYTQFMVAIDNGSRKGNDPNPSARAGVMQLGNGQGLALVRAVRSSSGSLEYQVVDATAPLGARTAEHTAFENKLTIGGQSTSYTAAGSYSLVRRNGLFPSSVYKNSEWELATTENDGVKSLGSRSYVAGLTPFAKNYTAYQRSNNPKGNPFWGNRTAPVAPEKSWGDLPTTGGNYRLDGTQVPPTYLSVPVSSGTATEQQAAYPIGNSFDKSYATFYHSKNRGQNPAFPITLTYNLAEPKLLTHIVYVPRDFNGSINAYSIKVTYADGTMEDVAMPELGSPTGATTITWQGIDKKPIKTVSFIVRSTGYGVLAVAEMEFFTKNPAYFDPTSIFTDLSCSELRSSVTYE